MSKQCFRILYRCFRYVATTQHLSNLAYTFVGIKLAHLTGGTIGGLVLLNLIMYRT